LDPGAEAPGFFITLNSLATAKNGSDEVNILFTNRNNQFAGSSLCITRGSGLKTKPSPTKSPFLTKKKFHNCDYGNCWLMPEKITNTRHRNCDIFAIFTKKIPP